MSSKSMQHWNGDQVCVIDTETTGLMASFHEMIQIAILPLDADLMPRKDVIPFYIEIRPDHPERASKKAMEINKLTFAKIAQRGFDREKAKDMLREWIEKLGLPVTTYGTPKRIIPLGQNYGFDKGFLMHWLGIDMYDEFFHYHYRDTMIAAGYLNDRAAMHGNPVPFSKINLQYLCSTLKIPRERSHDALEDCVATAQVYRRMLQEGLLG